MEQVYQKRVHGSLWMEGLTWLVALALVLCEPKVISEWFPFSYSIFSDSVVNNSGVFCYSSQGSKCDLGMSKFPWVCIIDSRRVWCQFPWKMWYSETSAWYWGRREWLSPSPTNETKWCQPSPKVVADFFNGVFSWTKSVWLYSIQACWNLK